MPKRDDDRPVSFAPAVSTPTVEARNRPGPAKDPNSLAERVRRGDAAHLHAVIDKGLHKRLKRLSVETERSISELVEEAVVELLSRK